MDLESKEILITGSNRGIGLELAKQAAKHKMKIHMLNRSKNPETIQSIKALGALTVNEWVIDMEQPESIDKFYKDFSSQGFLADVLVNNAGQLTGGLLEEQPIEKIYSMFQVNLVGLVHLTRLFLPQLLKRPQAKIVNNSSVSGMMYLPCASTYAASKAGVVAFTESLRNELEGTSVSTLLMVTPGVKTRMFDEIPDLYSNHLQLSFLNSIPAEKWAKRVFECLKDDQDVCWPSGQSYFGVKLGQHWPKMLSRIVKPYFERQK